MVLSNSLINKLSIMFLETKNIYDFFLLKYRQVLFGMLTFKNYQSLIGLLLGIEQKFN